MTSGSVSLTADEAVSRARALVPVLAGRAARTESLRRLPAETVGDLVASGLLRVAQPKRFGGAELPLPCVFDIVSELSRGCGSAGWTYSVLAAHGFFLAQFPELAQQDVWGANPDAVMSSCFAGGVQVDPVDDGYRIEDGTWQYSSGVHHADWTALLSHVPGGPPRFLLVPRGDFEIIDDWHAAGLVGSGSCSVRVRGVTVPAHRSLSMPNLLAATGPGRATNDSPLYALPFFANQKVFMTSMAVGIARAALADSVARTRNRRNRRTGEPASPGTADLTRLGSAAARIDAAAAAIRGSAEQIMAEVTAAGGVEDETQARTRRDCAFGVRLCVEAVEELFLASGASSLDTGAVIQRCWRDVHAVAQHRANNIDDCYGAWAERVLGLGDGLRFA